MAASFSPFLFRPGIFRRPLARTGSAVAADPARAAAGNMAAGRPFRACACFFSANIFVELCGMHVCYRDERQLRRDYGRVAAGRAGVGCWGRRWARLLTAVSLQALRERGCGSEEQMAAVLREVSAELRAGTEGWQLLSPFSAAFKSPLWWEPPRRGGRGAELPRGDTPSAPSSFWGSRPARGAPRVRHTAAAIPAERGGRGLTSWGALQTSCRLSCCRAVMDEPVPAPLSANPRLTGPVSLPGNVFIVDKAALVRT